MKTDRRLVRRILGMIPVLAGISFMAFCLINLTPGDPAEVALRVQEITPTPEAIQEMRQELGLDRPFPVRYLQWLNAVLHGDFGRSFANNRPVINEVARALPATLWLAAVSLAIILGVSITAGVFCSLAHGSAGDILIRGIVFWTTAMPSFWIGLLLMWCFAVKLDWLPTSGMEGLSSVVLPAVTLSLAYVSTYFRLIRNTMVQNRQEPYVFYAQTLGLKERTITRYVFKNSLLPSLAALGMSLPKLISGTVIVENIFAWPGMGRLCVTAVFNRDYPVIQAYVLIMAVLFVTSNFLADLISTRLDPRLAKAE